MTLDDAVMRENGSQVFQRDVYSSVPTGIMYRSVARDVSDTFRVASSIIGDRLGDTLDVTVAGAANICGAQSLDVACVRQLRDYVTTAYKPLLVDMLSAVSFSVVVGGGIELASGLGIEKTIASRKVMAAYSLLMGRAGGRIRDSAYRTAGLTTSSSAVPKFAIDVATNFAVYIPFYVWNLHQTGASMNEMFNSGCAMFGMSFLTSRPFGKWQDYVRTQFGIPAADAQQSSDSDSND